MLLNSAFFLSTGEREAPEPYHSCSSTVLSPIPFPFPFLPNFPPSLSLSPLPRYTDTPPVPKSPFSPFPPKFSPRPFPRTSNQHFQNLPQMSQTQPSPLASPLQPLRESSSPHHLPPSPPLLHLHTLTPRPPAPTPWAWRARSPTSHLGLLTPPQPGPASALVYAPPLPHSSCLDPAFLHSCHLPARPWAAPPIPAASRHLPSPEVLVDVAPPPLHFPSCPSRPRPAPPRPARLPPRPHARRLTLAQVRRRHVDPSAPRSRACLALCRIRAPAAAAAAATAGVGRRGGRGGCILNTASEPGRLVAVETIVRHEPE